jgi:HK97 family phage major capsid protein
MSKLIEMRDKRAKAWDATKAFLETHRTERGTLSAEDDAIYNRMDKEIDEYTKEIARLERIEARDAELAKAVSSPITEKPAGAVKEKTGRASDAYKEDFACILRGKPVLHNVLSTSPDVDGGYLVPEEFENQIVTGLEETNVIRSICQGDHDLRRTQDSHRGNAFHCSVDFGKRRIHRKQSHLRSEDR